MRNILTIILVLFMGLVGSADAVAVQQDAGVPEILNIQYVDVISDYTLSSAVPADYTLTVDATEFVTKGVYLTSGEAYYKTSGNDPTTIALAVDLLNPNASTDYGGPDLEKLHLYLKTDFNRHSSKNFDAGSDPIKQC